MIYGFDTSDQHAATAALLVYVVYRSRDRARFTVTPDMWGRIERYVKDAAKRATSLPEFLEALKRAGRLNAPTLHPRHLEVGLSGEAPITPVLGADGKLAYAVQFSTARETGLREFGTQVLERADAAAVIGKLYRETTWVVLLVRDRLEREKPIEQHLDVIDRDDLIQIEGTTHA